PARDPNLLGLFHPPLGRRQCGLGRGGTAMVLHRRVQALLQPHAGFAGVGSLSVALVSCIGRRPGLADELRRLEVVAVQRTKRADEARGTHRWLSSFTCSTRWMTFSTGVCCSTP